MRLDDDFSHFMETSSIPAESLLAALTVMPGLGRSAKPFAFSLENSAGDGWHAATGVSIAYTASRGTWKSPAGRSHARCL